MHVDGRQRFSREIARSRPTSLAVERLCAALHRLKFARVAVFALLGALLASTSLAQHYSEPNENYLHEIVQEWAGKTSQGNLRTTRLAENDLELRIWAGFGLVGTTGAILRRRDGEWSASRIFVERYFAGATEEIARREGLLPPCIVESMRSRCTVQATESVDGDVLDYDLQCAETDPVTMEEAQRSLGELWDDIKRLGVLELPPTIERDWVMLDGHSYVIEVRAGEAYRATVVEHAHDTDVDKQIHQIVVAMDTVLNTDLYGGPE